MMLVRNITKTGCGGEVLEVAKKVKMRDMTRAIGSTRKKERKKEKKSKRLVNFIGLKK